MSDVSDIDYKKIVKVIKQTEQLTKAAHAGLAGPVFEAVPKMFLSAAEVNADVGAKITAVQGDILASLNDVFHSILTHEQGVQNKQVKEKPKDFINDPVPDLREKIATGFPREDPAFFKEVIPVVKI